MSSPTSITSAPHTTAPHHHILTSNIHISTLQFIAALLLTLMLLWHISTITLIENYQMPAWWVKDFLAEHANGWRVAVWVIVGLLVLVDCMHALLCLDWWCALLHGRENLDRVPDEIDEDGRSRNVTDHRNDVTDSKVEDVERSKAHSCPQHTPSTFCDADLVCTQVDERKYPVAAAPPYTRHPLLHSRLTLNKQKAFLSIFDLLMVISLTGHIVTYFVSLPSAIAFCSLPAIMGSPDEIFGEDKVPLSVQDRCIGLNMDIHVAGGFAVFMALILALLHLAALVVRLWEWHHFGGQRQFGKHSADEDYEVRAECVATMCMTIKTPSPPSSQTCDKSLSQITSIYTFDESQNTTISADERSTGVRSVDRGGEGTEQTARRRAVCTDRSVDSKAGSKWGEMLLECLIDV